MMFAAVSSGSGSRSTSMGHTKTMRSTPTCCPRTRREAAWGSVLAHRGNRAAGMAIDSRVESNQNRPRRNRSYRHRRDMQRNKADRRLPHRIRIERFPVTEARPKPRPMLSARALRNLCGTGHLTTRAPSPRSRLTPFESAERVKAPERPAWSGRGECGARRASTGSSGRAEPLSIRALDDAAYFLRQSRAARSSACRDAVNGDRRRRRRRLARGGSTILRVGVGVELAWSGGAP